MNNKYDLIIVGGGTSGVSCAWNAAKRGLKTLIIEQNSFLGGSITSALVVPAMKTSENSINNDFFDNLYKKLESIGGAITYCDGNKGWFNPELTKIALDMLMNDAGVDILFESIVTSVEHKDNKILSLYIETIGSNNVTSLDSNLLSSPIDTLYLVDATGDAKICEKLSCEFLDVNYKKQPVSLRFIMSGVNTDKFIKWLMEYDTDRNITTSCSVNDYSYCSTAYTWDNNTKWALKPLFDDAIANNIITKEDSNYFQIFSVAGTSDSIAFNAPRLINTTTNPYIDGRLAILRLANFCKKYFFTDFTSYWFY